MGMGLLLPGDVAAHVEKRLCHGWVAVLFSDTETLSKLEKTVYSPDKGLNDGFELMMGPHPGKGIQVICLGKKTDELRKFLGITDDVEWESIFVVCIASKGETAAVEVIGFSPGLDGQQRLVRIKSLAHALAHPEAPDPPATP